MVLRVLPWLVVAFLLSAGIRHTHTIDWEECPRARCAIRASSTFFEFSNELWVFEQVGGRVVVTGAGTRRAPWFFAWYSDFHSRNGAIAIRKIESVLEAERGSASD